MTAYLRNITWSTLERGTYQIFEMIPLPSCPKPLKIDRRVRYRDQVRSCPKVMRDRVRKRFRNDIFLL